MASMSSGVNCLGIKHQLIKGYCLINAFFGFRLGFWGSHDLGEWFKSHYILWWTHANIYKFAECLHAHTLNIFWDSQCTLGGFLIISYVLQCGTLFCKCNFWITLLYLSFFDSVFHLFACAHNSHLFPSCKGVYMI